MKINKWINKCGTKKNGDKWINVEINIAINK